MNLIEIDKVEVEPLQTGLHGMHDVLARQTDRVRSRSGSSARLGRDDDAFAGHLRSRNA